MAAGDIIVEGDTGREFAFIEIPTAAGGVAKAMVTIPVSTLGAAGSGLTNTELRATPVPVSGTVAITAAQLPSTLGIKTAAASISIAPASDASFAVSAASLPLPSGASTAAKQPALGTAGTASADVISVQGIASMTPLLVNGSGVTQPVSGTFWQATQPVSGTFWQATQPVSAASLPLPSGASTSAKQDTLAAIFTAPFPLATTPWTYAAAASGISNTTTAVTVKAADGSLRNYVSAMQIMWEALGTATEIALRDGAAGTVLWRAKIPAALAGSREIIFPIPLKGTAATLLEVLTLTASTTGAVYWDLQGFVAA